MINSALSSHLGSFGSMLLTIAMAQELAQVMWDLRWMCILSVVIVFIDLWFGINESKKRNKKEYDAAMKAWEDGGRQGDEPQKKKIRESEAGRKTLCKIVDYVAIMALGALFGLAINENIGYFTHKETAAVALGVCCLFELSSIAGHWCYIHGIEYRFSLKGFVVGIIKAINVKIGNAVESGLNESEKETYKEKENGKD